MRAMTPEEVAELVGSGEAAAEVPAVVAPEEAEIITAAKTPAIARYRIGAHRARMPPMLVRPDPVRRSGAYHRRMAALYERELATA